MKYRIVERKKSIFDAVLYCFEGGRLRAIQGVIGMSPEQALGMIEVQEAMGRRAVPSTCGRITCSWCRQDLGPAPGILAGQITHGICEPCKNAALAEVQK